MSNVIRFQRYFDATHLTVMQTKIWLQDNGWKNPRVRFIPRRSGIQVLIERLPHAIH